MATKKAIKKQVSKGDVWKVPFKNLHIIDGLNIRADYGDIKALADSIRENGVKVPFQGYREGEEFFVVDGHRRYKALELLNAQGVKIISPFIVEPKGTSEEMRVVNMVITNDGKPLNPLELAEAVKRLLAYGWSDKEIATAMGKSGAYIGKLNKLNTAPKKFTKLVANGDISPTLAIQIAGNDEIESFMAQYESGELAPVASDGSKKKITAKHLKKADSWKYFKKFSTTVDESTMKNHQKDTFNFMLKVSYNQVSAQEFAEFFNQE